jgi:hypothetical protein
MYQQAAMNNFFITAHKTDEATREKMLKLNPCNNHHEFNLI